MTPSEPLTTLSFLDHIKSLFRRLVKTIADLRLAIVLFLIIALASVTGTLIVQGRSLAYYQANYPEDPALLGFISWKVILATGLNHVYSTWWFLSLLAFFGTSLTACTFIRQVPALKAARRWKFYTKPKQLEKLALSTELETGSLESLTPLLEARNYRIFQEGDSLYARKGLIGRIGPIVVHASMLLILGGAIWGSLTGFVAQEIAASGQTFSVRNIFEVGPFSSPQSLLQDWQIKVNRFWIDYTPEGSIDQFYSDLSVVDNQGQEVDRKTIYVNEPLRYNGVTFYQTDWGIAAIQVQVNNSPIFQLPMARLDTGDDGRLWGTWIPIKPDLSEGVSLLTRDLQGTLLVYDVNGNLYGAVRTGTGIEVNGVTVKVLNLIGSTGLQIKSDPGIPLVYAGFGFLMIGVVMSYVSHSQIWAFQNGDRFYFGGRTNRAQVTFERELVDILDQLKAKSVQDPPSKQEESLLIS